MKKKILHLTLGHSAFDDRIYFKECTSLQKYYDVLILAFSRDGRLYDMSGYHKNPGQYRNIKLHGFSAYHQYKYFSIIEKRLGLLAGRINEKLDKLDFRPDLVHCHEFPSLFQAIKIKKRHGCKLIYDVHEFFLGYSFDRFNNKFIKIGHFILNLYKHKKLYKHVDATVSVNDIIRSYNVTMNPDIRHIIVKNGYIFAESYNSGSDIDGKIVLLHEGTLRFNRGLRFIVEIFEDSWFRENVKVKIIGELKNAELKYFNSAKEKMPWLENCFEQTGWLDYEDVPKHLCGSIGLILMEPFVNNLLAGPPNKLFNYISGDIPVISFDIPATSRMINEYGVGLVVDRKKNAFKEAVKNISGNYGVFTKNINKHRNHFKFETDFKKLLELYQYMLH